MKKKSENVNDVVIASSSMMSSLKAQMKGKKFYDFLVSVMAMKKKGSEYIVLKYPNDEIQKYEEMFVKKSEITLNDGFVFEKYAKQERWDDEWHKSVSTGYFYPIAFWKFIEDHA